MEEYESTKTETFDELVTKHTRRELEELALKHGVKNLGGTKSQLADSVLEAMKKQKEQPKATITQASPKEAPMVEKPKIAAKKIVTGKKGVMAKVASINNKTAEVDKAGREIREEGIREMNKSVKEFNSARDSMSKQMHSEALKMTEDGQRRFKQGQAQFKTSLDMQIKENMEAVKKTNSGVKEIQASQVKMSREFVKAGNDIRDAGYKNLQNGLNLFNNDLKAQIRENQEAASRMKSGAVSLQNDFHKYQEQDLKNYVRDFYYG
jgi:hypothetical protein